MTLPNAKICPRCSKVVPAQCGVCDHCARLFRTPIEGTAVENRTIMFDHLSFPPAVVPRPAPRRPFLWLDWPLPAARLLMAWLLTSLQRLQPARRHKSPPPQKFTH